MPGNLTPIQRKGHGVLRTDIGFQFVGGDQARFAFQTLKQSVQRKITRIAMNAAVRVVAKEAKRLAPRDSGVLAKSIGSKSKTYPSGVTIGIVGARRGFGEVVERRAWQSGERADARGRRTVLFKTFKRFADPAKYIHLVEMGTQAHTLGGTSKVGKQQLGATHPGTKASRFMQRAWDSKRGEALNAFNQNLNQGIAREVNRLANKARSAVGK